MRGVAADAGPHEAGLSVPAACFSQVGHQEHIGVARLLPREPLQEAASEAFCEAHEGGAVAGRARALGGPFPAHPDALADAGSVGLHGNPEQRQELV